MAIPNDIDDWQIQYNDTTQATLCKLYDSHAEHYEKIMGSHMDLVHAMTVTTILKWISNKGSRLLDFAAATGLLGKQLYSKGYTNLDAHDGSAPCIEECRKKQIYKNFIVEFVYDDRQLTIDTDSYDGIVSCGGFSKNHLPLATFSEWVRIVKPGGYIVNTFRQKWMTDEPMYNQGKMVAEFDKLQQEGKWKFISKQVDDEEEEDKRFVEYVHQVL